MLVALHQTFPNRWRLKYSSLKTNLHVDNVYCVDSIFKFMPTDAWYAFVSCSNIKSVSTLVRFRRKNYLILCGYSKVIVNINY